MILLKIKKFWKILVALSLVTMLVGIPVIYLTLINARETKAVWFNDNWAYRKAITVTDTASEQNKYATLSSYDASDTTKYQSDCGDVRFTDQNGNLLDYTVSTCGATTTFRINMPSIPNGTTTIYLYYGNPSATNGFVQTDPYSACATCSTGTPGSEEKSPGPTLYWKFDDGTGTTAQDVSQNDLDGTLNNTPTWQTEDFCVSGKCLYFDGTNNENVSRADDSKLDFAAADNFSIQAWVKRNGASSVNNFILTKAQAGYTGYKLYMDASGDFCFDVSDGTNTDSACTQGVDFDDDKWHHVVGTKQGTTALRLYVDGNERAADTAVLATLTLANTGTFYVGVDLDGTSNEWLGFIDEVKVYRDNSVRSAAQVLADFNSRGGNEGAGTRFGENAQNLSGRLSSGLVGYWKMEESATPSLDSSGNSNSGTWNNQVAQTSGKFGYGTTYDGTDDYVQVADSGSLDVTSVTLAAWINPTALGGTVIQKSTSAGTDGYSMDTNGSKIRYCGSGGCTSSNTTLSTATWQHITVTVDANGTRFYLNGAPDGESSANTSVPTNALVLRMGVDSTSANDYNGKIDEARVYNRALSPVEVTALYNWAPGPVGYWKMDEKSGTTAYDQSTNANNGTLTNGPTWTQGKYGGGINFDGSNDFVTAGDPTNGSLDFGTGDFTIQFWIKTTKTTRWDPINKSAASQGAVGIYWDPTLKFNLHTDDGAGNNTVLTWNTPDITDGKWHYITAVRASSGTAMYIYRDGVLVASATGQTVRNISNTGSFCIGKHCVDNNYFVNGFMDEVKVYNYVRSAAQIIEDMNAGHPAPGSPLGSPVSYWKFDEGFGTTANDSSINANSLTMSTASWTNSGKFGKAWDGATNKRLSRSDDADLDFAATEDLSISLWFKSDSATNPSANEYLVEKGATVGTAAIGYAIYTSSASDGLICFGIDDDAVTNFPEDSVCSASDFYDATWHHIVAKKTGTSRLDLYIDGKPNGTPDTSISASGTLENTASFFVGDANTTDGSDEFLGDLDELKVYRLALTDDQVKQDMNRGSQNVLGALGDNSTYQPQAANQEYCVPGDTTSCVAPVGEWQFDEKNGPTAYDTGTGANNGTLTNGPTWANGKYGGGINFDVTNDYVSFGDQAAFDFSTAATLEAWIYPTVAQEGWIINKWASGTEDKYLDFGADRKVYFYLFNTFGGAALATTSTVPLNQWSHIVGTYDGTTARIYINGRQDNSMSASGDVADSTGVLYVGRNPDRTGGETNFVGRIDEVKIYNYARTPAQVAWDYNQGKPIGWWKMDECQGTTLFDASITNTNNGTWSGSGGGNTSAGNCTTVDTATAWYNGRTGKHNASLDFDGTDDVVTVANVTSIDLNDSLVAGHTFSAWINAATAGEGSGGQVYQKGDADTYLRVDTLASGRLDVEAALAIGAAGTADDANVNVSSAIATGAWNHIAVVWADDADDEIDLYINGQLRGTSTAGSGAPEADTGNLLIGGASTDNFDGQIDDVRIFNYPLTATQVKNLMNDGAVRYGPVTGSP